MKYKIGNFKANTKTEIQLKAKDILYQGNLNSTVIGDDLDFMIKYFEEFHIDWKLKKGTGLKNIKRVKEPNYGKYRGYRIERVDNSSTDISYIISNIQRKNYKREFNQAMRKVIKSQIIEFRNSAFQNNDILICPITQQSINTSNSHVDHINPTFDELLKSFITKYNIKLTSQLFPKEQDNQTEYDITDNEMKSNFFKFHKRKAKLRVVSIEGNLGQKKKNKG